MRQSYKNKSVTVVDLMLFVELARSLTKYFGKVRYWSPWHNSFPSSYQTEIGEGIAGIERIDEYLEVVDDTDLWVFPDTYLGKTQEYLQGIGKRVWGGKMAEEVEIYRSDAKKHFEKLGIPQGPYVILRGMKKLRDYLIKNDDKTHWVKIEKTRGDTETFKVEKYELSKNELDGLEFHLGPKAEITIFVVEEHLKDTIDLAIDTYCVDGEYPKLGLLGTEEKGECYVCKRQNYNEAPQGLIDIYEKMKSTFKQYGYRNFLSLESRMKGKSVLFGDPACRGGSPPLELQINMWKNLPDILWFGAEGELVEPEIESEYGVELIIHSDWANENPLLIEFPEEIKDKIKFRCNSEFDGKTWIMPQKQGPRVAAIVEEGDNLDDIIDQAKEDAGLIKGVQIENFSRSFRDIMGKIDQLREWGVTF